MRAKPVSRELTKQQFTLLCALEQNDGASQTTLVEITGIDRSTLAEMVRRMLEKGLLSRERTEEDQRANAVAISPVRPQGAARARAMPPTGPSGPCWTPCPRRSGRNSSSPCPRSPRPPRPMAPTARSSRTRRCRRTASGSESLQTLISISAARRRGRLVSAGRRGVRGGSADRSGLSAAARARNPDAFSSAAAKPARRLGLGLRRPAGWRARAAALICIGRTLGNRVSK